MTTTRHDIRRLRALEDALLARRNARHAMSQSPSAAVRDALARAEDAVRRLAEGEAG